MNSGATARDLRPDEVLLLKNADFSEREGAVALHPGFDLSLMSEPLPADLVQENVKILGVGILSYVQVWDGTTKVNRRKSLAIVQVNDNEGHFAYFKREFDHDDGVWSVWTPFDAPKIELDYGSSNASDRVRWMQLSDGAIRGAAGNETDEKPLWCGYVNRIAEDDNGFFRKYLGTTESDLDGVEGIFLGPTLPTVQAGILESSQIRRYGWNETLGGLRDVIGMVMIVPVIDGYQTLSQSELTAPSGYVLSRTFEAYPLYENEGVWWAYKYHLRVNWKSAGLHLSPRLTGFKVYLATKTRYPAGQYGAWQQVKEIDLQRGNLSATYIKRGTYGNDGVGYLQTQEDTGLYDGSYSYLNNLFVEIIVSEQQHIIERYPITNLEASQSEAWTKYRFDATGTQMQAGQEYVFEVRERWYAYDNDNADLMFIVTGYEEEIAPPPSYLPDPNSLLEGTYKFPRIDRNYRCQYEFEERHLAGNAYDPFTGAKWPLRTFYGDPKLTDYGGLDVLPNWFDVPGGADDDEIMGYCHAINRISVFTKYRIHQCAFDPILSIKPEVWSIGLVSTDTLKRYGRWWFFMGRSKRPKEKDWIIQPYVYDGINEPKAIGKITNEILAALKTDGVAPELMQAWINTITNQYQVAINQFSQAPTP